MYRFAWTLALVACALLASSRSNAGAQVTGIHVPRQPSPTLSGMIPDSSASTIFVRISQLLQAEPTIRPLTGGEPTTLEGTSRAREAALGALYSFRAHESLLLRSGHPGLDASPVTESIR